MAGDWYDWEQEAGPGIADLGCWDGEWRFLGSWGYWCWAGEGAAVIGVWLLGSGAEGTGSAGVGVAGLDVVAMGKGVWEHRSGMESRGAEVPGESWEWEVVILVLGLGKRGLGCQD